MADLIDEKHNYYSLPYYKIQDFVDTITKTAIEVSPKYRRIYEEYKKEITRFSPELEFCLHELGFMIYDPFMKDVDEVLFSNGNKYYVASRNYVLNPDFNRHNINLDIGFPVLTDDNINYINNLDENKMNEGIIDEKGYIDSSFASSIDNLADFMLMEDAIKSKEVYLDYQEKKELYPTSLEYITSKENVMSVKKLEDETISLEFVSENNGKIDEFINRLKKEGKLAELLPLVKDENTSIIKAV